MKLDEIFFKMGDTFLITSFCPPTIIARLPLRALSGPPDIGASIHDAPFSVLNLFEKFVVSSANVVDKSIIIVFLEAFLIIPFSLNTTSATLFVLSTHINITSQS